jgi:hypothetical protein
MTGWSNGYQSFFETKNHGPAVQNCVAKTVFLYKRLFLMNRFLRYRLKRPQLLGALPINLVARCLIFAGIWLASGPAQAQSPPAEPGPEAQPIQREAELHQLYQAKIAAEQRVQRLELAKARTEAALGLTHFYWGLASLLGVAFMVSRARPMWRNYLAVKRPIPEQTRQNQALKRLEPLERAQMQQILARSHETASWFVTKFLNDISPLAARLKGALVVCELEPELDFMEDVVPVMDQTLKEITEARSEIIRELNRIREADHQTNTY